MSERYDDLYDVEFDGEWEDEQARRQQRRWRIIVAVVSAILIVSLVAIPVMNVIDIAEGNDPDEARRNASSFVARQFTEAVLEDRSLSGSTRWAVVSLQEDVEALVGSLQARDAVELEGAEPALARRSCSRAVPDGAECFEAWLRRPDGPDLLRITFTIAIVNGEARVIDVNRLDAIAGGSLGG